MRQRLFLTLGIVAFDLRTPMNILAGKFPDCDTFQIRNIGHFEVHRMPRVAFRQTNDHLGFFGISTTLFAVRRSSEICVIKLNYPIQQIAFFSAFHRFSDPMKHKPRSLVSNAESSHQSKADTLHLLLITRKAVIIHSLRGSRARCMKVPFVAEISALQDLQRSR